MPPDLSQPQLLLLPDQLPSDHLSFCPQVESAGVFNHLLVFLLHDALVLLLILLFFLEELDPLLDAETIEELLSFFTFSIFEVSDIFLVYILGIFFCLKCNWPLCFHVSESEDAEVTWEDNCRVSVDKVVFEMLCELLSIFQVRTDFLRDLFNPFEV